MVLTRKRSQAKIDMGKKLAKKAVKKRSSSSVGDAPAQNDVPLVHRILFLPHVMKAIVAHLPMKDQVSMLLTSKGMKEWAIAPYWKSRNTLHFGQNEMMRLFPETSDMPYRYETILGHMKIFTYYLSLLKDANLKSWKFGGLKIFNWSDFEECAENAEFPLEKLEKITFLDLRNCVISYEDLKELAQYTPLVNTLYLTDSVFGLENVDSVDGILSNQELDSKVSNTADILADLYPVGRKNCARVTKTLFSGLKFLKFYPISGLISNNEFDD